MAEQIIFIIISAVTLIAAWFVVTDRNLFHAALALMASFLGVAGLYVLLEAGFIAAAQLLVYIGAISILLIFAIMMTRRLMQTTETAFNSQWQMGIVTAALLFAVLFFVIVQFWPMTPAAGATGRPDVPGNLLAASVDQLGVALVSADQYVLPFEVASVLLLAALIGAITVAWPEEVVTDEGVAPESTAAPALTAAEEEAHSTSEGATAMEAMETEGAAVEEQAEEAGATLEEEE